MSDKINVSRLQDAFRCEKYAHMKWREKKTPVFEYVPLCVGNAWHTAMETLLKGGTHELAQAAADEVFAEFERTSFDQLIETKQKEYADNKELVRILLPHVVIPREWEILQVEKELSIDLEPWARGAIQPNQIVLRGRPDAVVKWNGKLWHVQHKTASRSTNWGLYEQAIQRSFHEAAYLAMMADRFPEETVAGTLLLGLKKVAASTARSNPQAALHRAFIPARTESVVLAMKTMARKGAFVLAEDHLHEEGVPLSLLENRDACLGPFKNMPCPFLGVCEGTQRLEDPAFFKSYDPYARYTAEGEE